MDSPLSKVRMAASNASMVGPAEELRGPPRTPPYKVMAYIVAVYIVMVCIVLAADPAEKSGLFAVQLIVMVDLDAASAFSPRRPPLLPVSVDPPHGCTTIGIES